MENDEEAIWRLLAEKAKQGVSILPGLIAQTEQLLGGQGLSNVDIMVQVWEQVPEEDKPKAMRELFNGYWHHIKQCQADEGIIAMANIQGSTFLEYMDLESLDFAYVSVVEGGLTAEEARIRQLGRVGEYKDAPQETLPDMAMAYVELEVLWRIIQEIKMLRYRLDGEVPR